MATLVLQIGKTVERPKQPPGAEDGEISGKSFQLKFGGKKAKTKMSDPLNLFFLD